MEHFLKYRFTQSGVVDDGTPLRDHLRGLVVTCVYVEPGLTETFEVTAEPGYLWLTNGLGLIVRPDRTMECRTFRVEYTGARSKGMREEISAGPVRIIFTNATGERYALMIIRFTESFQLTLTSFLSGAELLSNQTFRELFATETMATGEGLAIQRLALLFTDLKGSTALYDRIGDMQAFDLVRTHFGHLRECAVRNSGAIVKTIGDAVMASFVDPIDALRAALDMHARIARFNAEVGNELLRLKAGLHAGPCLAVSLNDRLDYFGQTVNIAARVQSLADANELVVTEDVLSRPEATELVAGLPMESTAVRLVGIPEPIRVHRVRVIEDSSGRPRSPEKVVS